MEEKGWYNGYGWAERNAKLRELKRLVALGEIPAACGPCQLCGDPDVPVEYHDEDYSKPYLWGPPALFALCRHCHRTKLHKRFAQPSAWMAFLDHVRRGGYARDLKVPSIKREVVQAQRNYERGERPSALASLRTYSAAIGTEWFAALTLDPIAVTASAPRPSRQPGLSPPESAKADTATALLRIQELFHGLIRSRAREGAIAVPSLLPQIASAGGTEFTPVWFPVDGMYGGFSYWIKWTTDNPPALHTKSWCRIAEGSEQYHVITPTEVRLVEEGRG